MLANMMVKRRGEGSLEGWRRGLKSKRLLLEGSEALKERSQWLKKRSM